jgi:hypothetical protein
MTHNFQYFDGVLQTCVASLESYMFIYIAKIAKLLQFSLDQVIIFLQNCVCIIHQTLKFSYFLL